MQDTPGTCIRVCLKELDAISCVKTCIAPGRPAPKVGDMLLKDGEKKEIVSVETEAYASTELVEA